MARFIGKCSKCGTVLAVVAEKSVRVIGRDRFGNEKKRVTFTFPNGETCDEPRHFVGCWTCPSRHGQARQIELHTIRGVVTEEECNAKCTGAAGHQCECSCGGKNHGGMHFGAAA